MDLDRLKKLIKKYRENMTYYHNSQNAYNETECRDEYINPLLECFGWDVENKQGKCRSIKKWLWNGFLIGLKDQIIH